MNLKGRKLLILSGIAMNRKIVAAARELGIYTIVTDTRDCEHSPAKKLADEHWEISYSDIETLATKCRETGVGAVLACSGETTQIPYYQLCRELGFPCYLNKKELEILTDKNAFKSLCREAGVGVIPDYSEEECLQGKAEFPVFVKPARASGSRGQAICDSPEQAAAAIATARKESGTGEAVIEKYLGERNSFQVTLFFVNGEPFVIRTADGYKGTREDRLDKVALCSISPSRYTEAYFEKAHPALTEMLKRIGLQNGPVMIQGFCDDGVFRFYDPGRRFPDTDYEQIFAQQYGVNPIRMLIEFAFTGSMPAGGLNNRQVYLDGNTCVILFPTLCGGIIREIRGRNELEKMPEVRSFVPLCHEGDTVAWTYTTKQRLAHITMLCAGPAAARETILRAQRLLKVTDTEGKDMIYCPFDPGRLEGSPVKA